jgi:LysM repeat protein
VLFSRGPSDENVTTGSDGTEAPAADAPGSTDARTSSSVATTIAGTTVVTATTLTTAAATPPEGTYTVVSGDGWYAIATKLDVPVDSLLQVNGATLTTPLGVGQVLKVPPKSTT